ncbi:Ig-like domain-containing protein, partial [Enterobacter sp. CC120223-11]|uniref:Ig-like domain-containing protein n=1 Tax=Enterobacter sp. CC120223-11 TaxID=1378073 RepID=UPI000BCA8064
ATVEPRPLSVEITIDTIGGDGFLNNAELSEKLTTISGTVSEGTPEGTEITLTMDGRPIGTATVNSDGTWSTAVETSLIKDGGEVTAEISLSDEYDNEVGDKAFTTVVPTPLDVEITIDDVTGDNFLSFAETNQLPGEDAPTIKVTGTVSGNAAEGDYINVTVGDVTHTVKVQKDGEGKLVWEAEFTAENLMKNPEVSASIEIRDDYGNVVNDSALTTVNVEMGNLITGNEHDNVLEGGDETSDLIIADTQGFQQQPGQDYNIAFIVDTSGSVNSGDIKSIIASLTKVFNSLHQNAQFDSSGKVNILLVDFDTQVNFAVSVDLRDPNALKTLTDALAKMTSGGGTNYEDAFKTTANWFHEVGGEGSENLTYFITDGKPTYYQTGEKSLIDVDSRSGSSNVVTLDLSTLNYTAGQVVTMKIAGHERVVIDAQGNVYSWNASDRQNVGVLRADGKGGYELSTLGGAGSSTSSTTTSNAHSAFLLLMGVCNNVEAIGINNGISANDLKPYDSDGNVMSGIAADKLAEAILGGDNVQMAGAQDTVHGNAGNDILFGDMVLFGGSSGFDAMKAYVADKLGVDASKLGVSHISQYIAEHPEEFDQSQNDGGKDVLFGGLGDDILYGGGGSDLLVGGSGDDLLFGGKGDDILLGDGYESASKLAEAMNTTVGKLTFEGVSDFISQNSDVLGGLGSGNDKLYGGEGKDLLIGGGGHDLLNGGDGNDLLFGGTGNDVLIGGKGNDMLIGGAGQDAFTWLKGDDGHDVIKDFNAKEGDRIDLSELLGGNIDNNLADYIQVSQNSNGDAVININTDGQMQSQGSTMSITVEGSSMADINSLLASPDNTAIIL